MYVLYMTLRTDIIYPQTADFPEGLYVLYTYVGIVWFGLLREFTFNSLGLLAQRKGGSSEHRCSPI
jgi:hypothetical protein